jgi:hypothetical protein
MNDQNQPEPNRSLAAIYPSEFLIVVLPIRMRRKPLKTKRAA